MMDITEIETLIISKRKELEDLETTLRVLKQIQGVSTATTVAAENVVEMTDLFDVSTLGVEKAKAHGLREDIIEILPKLGDQEFTTVHINAILKQLGKTKDTAAFRSRLSKIVRQLSTEGIIVLLQEGKGSSPHIYRNSDQQEDTTNED
ncbi:hypothetical protein [Vibrio owensii]|uniref:hypothetical protein n=1 Tax=Vibrio owensii TaxID=696485 RepID=UPI0040683B62